MLREGSSTHDRRVQVKVVYSPLYCVSVTQNRDASDCQPTEAYLRTDSAQPYSSSFGGGGVYVRYRLVYEVRQCAT